MGGSAYPAIWAVRISDLGSHHGPMPQRAPMFLEGLVRPGSAVHEHSSKRAVSLRLGGRCGSAASLEPFDHERLQVGTSGIDGGREARGSEPMMASFSVMVVQSSLRVLGTAWGFLIRSGAGFEPATFWL